MTGLTSAKSPAKDDRELIQLLFLKQTGVLVSQKQSPFKKICESGHQLHNPYCIIKNSNITSITSFPSQINGLWYLLSLSDRARKNKMTNTPLQPGFPLCGWRTIPSTKPMFCIHVLLIPKLPGRLWRWGLAAVCSGNLLGAHFLKVKAAHKSRIVFT